MAVTKRLRFEIFRRDNHACRYCGAAAPDVKLTVDHVVPTALGGADDPGNLVAACADCNSGKSSSSPDAPLVADVEADALRWAAAMRYAADVALREVEAIAAVKSWFDEVWCGWRTFDDSACADGTFPRPSDWESSIERFITAELPFPLLEEAVLTTMRNGRVHASKKWRYFCGICWRKLDELHQIARASIVAEEAKN